MLWYVNEQPRTVKRQEHLPPKPDLTATRQKHVMTQGLESNTNTAFHCFIPTPSLPSSEKGHFILLTLTSPDYKSHTDIPSQEPHATATLKPLANTPLANLLPGKSVIMPYTSPPIKTISQTTFYISRETITRALTIQALDTDQPALLRMEASKRLGLLTLNADFTRKPPRFPSCTLRTTRTQLLGHSPVPLDTSTDKWPKPETLSMKFISQHCTLLF